tara:strand:- start:925 stop:1614 length:690 start_codon:yes stop_codon:yes gene_type:complete
MDSLQFIEEQGVSIVANGTFNPAIFHPSWLLHHGLITEDENESARVEITHPEVSQFQVPGLRFDVQTERVMIQAAAEPFIRAADLYSEIFGRLLPHSPVESIGMNFWAHFKTRDWAQRQRFGRTLAPMEPWGDFAQLMERPDKESAGGFSTLAFKARYEDYGDLGSLNVVIQPSVRVDGGGGVFMNVNHHMGDSNEALPFSQLVPEKFDLIVRRSREIINHMIELARKS